MSAEAGLTLAQFLPYRLSLIANRVSRQLARLYAERFDLSIAQWRVLAVLAAEDDVGADHVCRMTAMDKVAVSRAVSRLVARRYVRRRRDSADRRRVLLSLSATGRRVYAQIVPLARAYETQLVSRLGGVDDDLTRVLDALEDATAADPSGR